jgi:tight adherence protein C
MPIYVVAAALAVALSLPVLWFSLAGDRVPGRRVSHILTAGLAPGGDLRAIVLSTSPFERLIEPLVRALASPARRLSPGGIVARLERRLELAGGGWPVERVLALKLAAAGAGLAGGLAWFAISPSGRTLAGGALVVAAGYLSPDAVLARRARARQTEIANRLPDTLDQLTICIEAGLGFDAALARTARSGSGPLAAEITQLLQELRVGIPRREALENLLARTEVPDLRQFVHAVTQAEIYGVPIARVLRSQAVEQREKRRFRAEERAMKLPVKVVFPLVFCILPTLFIVVLVPAFINLVKGL